MLTINQKAEIRIQILEAMAVWGKIDAYKATWFGIKRGQPAKFDWHEYSHQLDVLSNESVIKRDGTGGDGMALYSL